jgi:peroxiredoxin
MNNLTSEREIGPRLNTAAINFSLLNHEQREYSLTSLMGERGLLLCFIGDVWLLVNGRRIAWLQRYERAFARMGVRVAALTTNEPHTLRNFYASSPLPPIFPVLSDSGREMRDAFQIERFAAMLLIDRDGIVRSKWVCSDECVWPDAHKVVNAIRML